MSPALARETGVRWCAVEPAAALHWPEPRPAAGARLDVRAWLADAHPELGVLVLDDGVVHGRTGWVWHSDGRILADVSWWGERVVEQATANRLDTHPLVHLPGTVLSLLTDWGGENFAHQLHDGMTRAALFERAGLHYGDVDTVLVPASAIERGWCDDLGISRAKCRAAVPDTRYRCDRLVATTFPGTSKAIMPWAAEFLRARLPATPSDGATRFQLTRSTTRLLTNQHAIESLLATRGIATIDPSSEHSAMRSLFHGAELVVSAHGAGLADLVFCRPGTVVLELIPTDHVFPYWYATSLAVGLEYRYLACESTEIRPRGATGPSPFDATCDLDLLAEALDHVEALAAR